MPETAVKFYTYEYMKSQIGNKEYSFCTSLVSGAVAGTMS